MLNSVVCLFSLFKLLLRPLQSLPNDFDDSWGGLKYSLCKTGPTQREAALTFSSHSQHLFWRTIWRDNYWSWIPWVLLLTFTYWLKAFVFVMEFNKYNHQHKLRFISITLTSGEENLGEKLIVGNIIWMFIFLVFRVIYFKGLLPLLPPWYIKYFIDICYLFSFRFLLSTQSFCPFFFRFILHKFRWSLFSNVISICLLIQWVSIINYDLWNILHQFLCKRKQCWLLELLFLPSEFWFSLA